MNLETLYHFQYIAKHKNITKAAKYFYISQSTLSRNIISLENELDVVLFERTNKHLELTKAGETLAHDCELFITHMQNVVHNVQFAGQGSHGTLRITSPGQVCSVLNNALVNFRHDYPSIELLIETYDFNEIVSAVQYDLYNIGFTYDFAISATDELEVVEIDTDDFSLAVSSSLFPNPGPESIPAIVNSLPLILPVYLEPPFMKLILNELKRISNISNINTFYVNNTDSVMLDASLGLGYGIVPTSLTKAKSGIENISYVNLKDFSGKCSIVMIYKPESVSGITGCFLDSLKFSNKNK